MQHIYASGWSAGADPSAGSQFQQIAPISSLLRGGHKEIYYPQVLIRLNISSSCLGCPNLTKLSLVSHPAQPLLTVQIDLSLLPGMMQLTGSELPLSRDDVREQHPKKADGSSS